MTVILFYWHCRAVNPHSFFVDPDPSIFLNADPHPDVDPDPNADPDPALQNSNATLNL